MPTTPVVFYCDSKGVAPVLEWLRDLREQDKKAWVNCVARVEQLRQSGHELRRPAAAPLRDGIHELRAKKGHVQYRILYFFHGRAAAVLAHGITKDDAAVPDADIERALGRKKKFESDPEGHTQIV